MGGLFGGTPKPVKAPPTPAPSAQIETSGVQAEDYTMGRRNKGGYQATVLTGAMAPKQTKGKSQLG
jgi:hypothetical protein